MGEGGGGGQTLMVIIWPVRRILERGVRLTAKYERGGGGGGGPLQRKLKHLLIIWVYR